MHQLARIAGIGLQQHRLLMATATNTGAVVELALAAVVRGVQGLIPGQRLIEGVVMSRHIALLGAGYGEHQAFMLLEQRLLDRRQDLVGVLVEARPVACR
ncbi:hypothetical protein D3C77_688460 [compost metagenome]